MKTEEIARGNKLSPPPETPLTLFNLSQCVWQLWGRNQTNPKITRNHPKLPRNTQLNSREL